MKPAFGLGDNENMNTHLRALLASTGPVVERIRQQIPQTMAVYAFGSQVHGTANAQSDLDLAVLVAGYADPLVLWSLAGELSDTVACPVDLLDLRRLHGHAIPGNHRWTDLRGTQRHSH